MPFDENDGYAADAFQVGMMFQRFIGECHDGRDLARFFMRDDLPAWVRQCGEPYEKATSPTTSLDNGIAVAVRILREQGNRCEA